MEKISLFKRVKKLILGGSRDVEDPNIFHKISLIAFFAWIGLGADGLSSSCYGPQEAFLALKNHPFLGIFVGLATVLTIFIISSCYMQIVELFPTGGGGYFVASKLLSPTWGMISGCALMIDYILTITVSIASGADAFFSLLPVEYQAYKLTFAVCVVAALILLNMRGAKESILPLVPIFMAFLITHAFIIFYALVTHVGNFGEVGREAVADIHRSFSELGVVGAILLMLRAYTMGAGTYTGLEAVSNGMIVLREPRVQTAKRTMQYMAASLAFVVMGLILSYIFYAITPVEGKTSNAIFFELATVNWNPAVGYWFIFIALISEAMLLFVAAQAGFLDGPRVLANMAVDRWFPTRFSILSDRLAMRNGILIIGSVAIGMMIFTHGSVRFLVVLYSINVFITFSLSLLGMTKHWWQVRKTVVDWGNKIFVSGIGFVLCFFILIAMLVMKFHDGGWITLLITGTLAVLALAMKRHYIGTAHLLRRLNKLVVAVEQSDAAMFPDTPRDASMVSHYDAKGKTAVILVSGFNGMGLHTLFGVIRMFGNVFRNFVFLEIGVLDAGNFKGVHEVDRLREEVQKGAQRYVEFMNKNGYYAEAMTSLGVNVVDETAEVAPSILKKYPNAIFFGGQLLFEKESFWTPMFHNYTAFALQKRLYYAGVPFVVVPIRI